MTTPTPLIVAIDGPAGSGKTSTAREAARRLGFVYLDTGAMYRALTLAALDAGVPVTDEAMERLLAETRLDVGYEGQEMTVRLDGTDVSSRIREPRVARAVSAVSALAAVRSRMVEAQRRIAREQLDAGRGVVVDGRDIGTVVFPDAPVKVFMSANSRIRAQRRHRELAQKGDAPPIEDVHADILERDRLDSERALAPLRKADDAVVLDTGDLSMDAQVSFVVNKVMERQGTSPV